MPDSAIPAVVVHAMKLRLKHDYAADLAAGRRGPENTYGEMLRVLSHPAAIQRLRSIDGTSHYIALHTAIVLLGRLLIVVVPLAWLTLGWKWALAFAIVWFAGLSPIQTALNFELAARLAVFDSVNARLARGAAAEKAAVGSAR